MFEFLKKCFVINLDDYENIGFSLEINKVVFGASIVLIIGIVLLNTYRGTIKNVVLQLIRHGASSEETAKKLSEIGLNNSKTVRYLLGGNNTLTKIVARTGEKKYSYEEYVALSKDERKEIEKIDYDKSSFYIRDEQAERASLIVEKYTVSVTKTVLACLFVGAVCVCVISCMSVILNVLNNLLKNI